MNHPRRMWTKSRLKAGRAVDATQVPLFVALVSVLAVGCDAGTSGGATAGSAGVSALAGASNAAGGANPGGGADAAGGTNTGGTNTGGANAGGATAGSSTGGGAQTGGTEAPFSYFKRGLNLGNRLDAPNEGDWGAVLQAADFPRIAQRGFDHIRLPIRFSGHAAAASPYTIEPTLFARVDWAVQQAKDAGLAILIDLHHYDELQAAPAVEQERFVALWTQIAEHYQSAPEQVAFELLNEPSGAMDTAWNALVPLALAAVRKSNPTRLVVVDSTNFAAASTLSALQLPDDPRLMAAVHLYEPSLFAFQGQEWMGPIWATTGIVFPGPPSQPVVPVQAALDAPWAKQWFSDYNTLPAAQNPSGPKMILTQIQQATAFSARTKHPVYNGEWGPQGGADMTSRSNYIRAMRTECEKAGLTWAIWEDATNMKLFDPATGAWEAPLVDALFQ
jgi:endoglucanase